MVYLPRGDVQDMILLIASHITVMLMEKKLCPFDYHCITSAFSGLFLMYVSLTVCNNFASLTEILYFLCNCNDLSI